MISIVIYYHDIYITLSTVRHYRSALPYITECVLISSVVLVRPCSFSFSFSKTYENLLVLAFVRFIKFF